MATNSFAQFALAATETDTATGFTGTVGTPGTRKSLPNADIAYTITVDFDGSGDVATVNLDNGTATGDVVGVKATGTFTFSGGLPIAAQTMEVNGTTYTFVASSAGPTEITIGANETATAANAASIISANDPEVDAVNVGGTLTISAANTGEYGNAITISESATNVTVSGATLSGGVDKVVITGDGVDALGTALPTASKIHGILVTATSGKVTMAVTTLLKGEATDNGGCLFWDSDGRTDLLENLTLTSGAANTVCQLVVRAQE